MDFDILPQIVIIISTAGILFIMGKNFSKMKEAGEELFLKESEKEKEEKEKFIYLYKRALRRINKENYQKKVAEFWLWLEKLLRKIRIVFLKLDSRIVSVLERLRKKNVESLEEFRKITEENIRKTRKEGGFWSNNRRNKMKNAEKPSTNGVEALADIKEETKNDSIVDNTVQDLPIEENITFPEETAERKNEGEIFEMEYAEEYISKESGLSNESKENAEIETEGIRPVESIIYTESVEDVEETLMDDKKEEVETEEEKEIRTKKEQECIEILIKNPADIKAYWKLGIIYSKRRNYEDALACFRQIVKIDPTYTKAKQKAIELMEKMKNRGK